MEDKLSWKERKQLKKEEKEKIKKEKKELKEEYKKVQKVVIDLLPFLNITEDGEFITKNGYIDIYQIKSKDLNSLNNDEINRHIYEFTSFLRGYTDDLKIISMHYPVNTKVQQENIENKINKTNNPIYIKYLNEKLEELKALEKIRKNKEFYLMLFFKNKRDKKEKEIYLNRKLSNAIGIKEIDIDKKIKILYKLNNQNSKI